MSYFQECDNCGEYNSVTLPKCGSCGVVLSSYYSASHKIKQSSALCGFHYFIMSQGGYENHEHFDWVLSASEEDILKWLEAMYDEPGTVF